MTINNSTGASPLRLGTGLTGSNVDFNVSGNSLIITDSVTGDTIDIQGQYGYGIGIQTLIFGNNNAMSLAGGLPIVASGSGIFTGTAGNDTLIGGTGTETLSGNGGNDTFIAGSGSETLLGKQSGNDTYEYAQAMATTQSRIMAAPTR